MRPGANSGTPHYKSFVLSCLPGQSGAKLLQLDHVQLPGAGHQVSPRQFGGMSPLALDKQLQHLALPSLSLPGYAAAQATLVLHSGFVTTGALAGV